MKTFAVKEKQSVPAVRKARPHVHHPMGPVLQAQQVEIRRILRSTGAQAKLTIGQPNDKYEQEADRVADQVMAMPDPKLQRQPEKEEEEETLQTKPLADQITPLVQRQEDLPDEGEEELQTNPLNGMVQHQAEFEDDEEVTLQAKANTQQIPTASPGLLTRINALKGSGQPLPPSTRAFFEPRFGQDFSQVRIHTGPKASDTARSINAKAFTVGRNVVFGAGQHQLQTMEGKRLLAHELVHVGQQIGANSRQLAFIQRQESLELRPQVISSEVPLDYGSITNDGQAIAKEETDRSLIQSWVTLSPRILIKIIEEKIDWLRHVIYVGFDKFGPRVRGEIAKTLIAMDDALWEEVIMKAPLDPLTNMPIVEGLSWDPNDPLAPLSPFGIYQIEWAAIAGEYIREKPEKKRRKRKNKGSLQTPKKDGPIKDTPKKEEWTIEKVAKSTKLALARVSKTVFPTEPEKRLRCVLNKLIRNPSVDSTYLNWENYAPNLSYITNTFPKNESDMSAFLTDFKENLMRIKIFSRSDEILIFRLKVIDKSIMKVLGRMHLLMNSHDIMNEGHKYIMFEYFGRRMLRGKKRRIDSIYACYSGK